MVEKSVVAILMRHFGDEAKDEDANAKACVTELMAKLLKDFQDVDGLRTKIGDDKAVGVFFWYLGVVSQIDSEASEGRSRFRIYQEIHGCIKSNKINEAIGLIQKHFFASVAKKRLGMFSSQFGDLKNKADAEDAAAIKLRDEAEAFNFPINIGARARDSRSDSSVGSEQEEGSQPGSGLSSRKSSGE